MYTFFHYREHKHARKPAFPGAEGYDTHTRRLSDPTARLRREWVKCSRLNWKMSNSPNISQEEESEEGEASTQGYDSGYHDEMQSKSSKTHDSTLGPFSPTVSDSEGPHDSTVTLKKKAIMHPLPLLRGDKDHSSMEEHTHPVPLTISHNKPKRPLMKSHSFGSIGGTSSESVSLSVSSLWDFHTPQTMSDYLSSLGFDDFQSPQLVPDRFIPKNLEHVKPMLMKQQSVLGDLPSYPPPSPDYASGHAPVHPETGDLPLGASAKTFFVNIPIPPSPPPLSYDSTSNTTTDAMHPDYSAAVVYTDPSISQINRGRVLLETVPEETASDLSPSPRWLSPRVSIEDVTECKLGSNLAVPKKKRLLAQRDSHEQSISSQVESEPESIYFTYDEIAKDRETKSCPSLPLPSEDSSQQNRKHKGVYSPPPGLLTWLSTQQTIDEEECPDPDELPWPFSEQARLRKSLTEIQQAQQASLDEEHKQSPVITINDNPLTPVVCNDSLPCSYDDMSSSCEYWTPPSCPGRPLPSRLLPPDSVGDDKQPNYCSR